MHTKISGENKKMVGRFISIAKINLQNEIHTQCKQKTQFFAYLSLWKNDTFNWIAKRGGGHDVHTKKRSLESQVRWCSGTQMEKEGKCRIANTSARRLPVVLWPLKWLWGVRLLILIADHSSSDRDIFELPLVDGLLVFFRLTKIGHRLERQWQEQ